MTGCCYNWINLGRILFTCVARSTAEIGRGTLITFFAWPTRYDLPDVFTTMTSDFPLTRQQFTTFFFFTTVLSQWDFSYGIFELLSPGKASCDRVMLPNLRCMLGVLAFLPNSDMDYRIFNISTDVYSCDCIRGCRDIGKRVFAES